MSTERAASKAADITPVGGGGVTNVQCAHTPRGRADKAGRRLARALPRLPAPCPPDAAGLPVIVRADLGRFPGNRRVLHNTFTLPRFDGCLRSVCALERSGKHGSSEGAGQRELQRAQDLLGYPRHLRKRVCAQLRSYTVQGRQRVRCRCRHIQHWCGQRRGRGLLLHKL